MTVGIHLFMLISSALFLAASRRLEANFSEEAKPKISVAYPGSEGNTVITVSRARRSTGNTSSHATSRARAIQGQVCPQRCNGTQLMNPIRPRDCFQCVPCTCEPDCHKYGSCCPESGESWRPPPLERSQCRSDHFSKGWVKHVVACDPDYPTGKTRNLCESKTVPRRRDTVLPVSSAETNITYANIYCAKCNHDDKTAVEWSFSCNHNQYFYHAVNNSQYDILAIQKPEICQSSSFTIKSLTLDGCRPDTTLSLVVSSCNITGGWKEHDELTREACEDADWSRGDIVSIAHKRFYANIMCALCNEDERIVLGTIDTMCMAPPPPIYLRPMTGLLQYKQQFGDSATISSLTGCSEDQWKHPQVTYNFFDCLLYI